MLEATIALRRDLTRLIRRFRPDAVVCGDPTVRYYGSTYLNHPDHRAAADAALDAVFPSAGTRLIFPELLGEGLEPHEVRQVYIHGADRSDTYVDIAGTLDVKLAALREHRSQMGEWIRRSSSWSGPASRASGPASRRRSLTGGWCWKDPSEAGRRTRARPGPAPAVPHPVAGPSSTRTASRGS